MGEEFIRDCSLSRIDKAIEAADLAFWEVISKHYPGVESPKFASECRVAWINAIDTAVENWVQQNTGGKI